MTELPDSGRRDDAQETIRTRVTAARTRLMSDPSFTALMSDLQARLEAELVASGIPADQLVIAGDQAKEPAAGAARIPPGHECLIYFWDYCWFSVRVH